MNVSDVMSRDLMWVSPDAGVVEIASTMRDVNIGAVPVAANDKLLGMVTDRDLVIRALADGRDVGALQARQLMSPKILYCREDQSVEKALESMSKSCVRRMPVINADNHLVGMVSLGDLSRAADGPAGATLRRISEAGMS